MILLAGTFADLQPIIVFGAFMMATWVLLTKFSNRASQAEERLERLNRPQSLAEIDGLMPGQPKFSNLRDVISSLGGAMQPQTDLEKNSLKVTMANAGFRNEKAAGIYLGLRAISLVTFSVPAALYFLSEYGFTLKAFEYLIVFVGIGLYLPQIVLHVIKSGRQKEIFLSLPDALDLLVVCVESGLGLDAGLRKVTQEMKGQAKVMVEELELANMQLQMGRPRREVLHDLGVRTGVDDVRALAAILIQADRFGSSIAQALRVHSDSMRTRRRQLAEEKANKCAVQLIFPLVLFIFPAIFVVLVGPAAIQIQKNLLKN